MDKLIGCIFNWRWWLLKKYNTIWDKVSADIEKELDSEPVYKKNSFKTEIKLMAMKLQIFAVKKFLWWAVMILV